MLHSKVMVIQSMRFTYLDSKIDEITAITLQTQTFHCPNFKQFSLRTMFSDLGTVVTWLHFI